MKLVNSIFEVLKWYFMTTTSKAFTDITIYIFNYLMIKTKCDIWPKSLNRIMLVKSNNIAEQFKL